MTAIDETDQRILTMLEADGRATLAQLAQATGLSVSAAQSRVQKLEKRGIISCYSVAGAPSFVLVVRVASPTALEELLNLIHRTVPVSTETTMILQTYFAH